MMEAARSTGWHQDPSDRTTSRYWDGTAWRGELRWNGTAWVEAPTAVPAPASAAAPAPRVAAAAAWPAQPVVVSAAPAATPPHLASASTTVAAATEVGEAVLGKVRDLSKTALTLAAACGLGAIAVFLPWVNAATTYQHKATSPTASGLIAALLLAIVGGAAYLSAPVRRGTLPIRNMVGLVVANGLVGMTTLATFFLIGNEASKQPAPSGFGADYDAATQPTISAGIGLFLWGAFGMVLFVGIVQAWRDHAAAEQAS